MLCYAGGSGPPPPAPVAVVGGVQLLVNVETSVAGYAVVAVLPSGSGGSATEQFSLAASDLIKGSAVSAVASWGGGALASLSSLAGQKVQLQVAMADARLFSLKLACAAA